jgi:hypothetical protein
MAPNQWSIESFCNNARAAASGLLVHTANRQPWSAMLDNVSTTPGNG